MEGGVTDKKGVQEKGGSGPPDPLPPLDTPMTIQTMCNGLFIFCSFPLFIIEIHY